MWPGPPTHVIGAEFGWRLLSCVEGPHFVVWGGGGDPKTQLGLLLLHNIVCTSDETCFGLRLFLTKDFVFGVKVPSLPHIYEFHIVIILSSHLFLRKLRDGWQC